MGRGEPVAGKRLVKMRHEPRRKRALRQNVVKGAVWIFLVLFVASVVGVAIIAIR